jgi:crotonobetainyl-CoA:carnitine CoA-transferase CaiB-like acyl-CoA transferase
VLDLTRVLAGPVATRFLAGYGAQVLRIDPPDWDEPAVVPEVSLGKRCARLDLRAAEGRARFEALLAQADVLVHGYRPGALAHLGYDAAALRRLAPALIDVCLDAYGWSGPWAARRGFDSLVQMSSGIAAAGMRWRGADAPVPLPVQALDHASGYLLAAAAVRGLSARRADGRGRQARVSLARSARLLVEQARAPEAKEEPTLAPPADADWATLTEATSWGAARRLLPPVDIQGAAMQWSLPASALGSAAPFWAP